MPAVVTSVLLVATLAAAPDRAGPGYLGVSVRAAAGGLQVLRVVAGGPCAAAGVRAGDVLTALGAQRLRAVADLDRGLSSVAAAQSLRLTLWRGGRSLQLEVRAQRPPAAAEPPPVVRARPAAVPARDVQAEVRALRAELAALRRLLERLRGRRE